MIILQVITGFMVGVEFLWDEKMVVFDVGIIRLFVHYGKVE